MSICIYILSTIEIIVYYKLLQGWIAEMASHVKSIDHNHLLEIGHHGFYGESMKEKNPNNQLLGTDFIADNQIHGIDFATIHLYEDQWYNPSIQSKIRKLFPDLFS